MCPLLFDTSHTGQMWELSQIENNHFGSSPLMGNPIILNIIYSIISTLTPNHKFPMFTIVSNCLTQTLTSKLLPKWGISHNPRIPNFFNPYAHSFSSFSMILLCWGISHIYFSFTNSSSMISCLTNGTFDLFFFPL